MAGHQGVDCLCRDANNERANHPLNTREFIMSKIWFIHEWSFDRGLAPRLQRTHAGRTQFDKPNCDPPLRGVSCRLSLALAVQNEPYGKADFDHPGCSTCGRFLA
jgi:hypothetical protein